MKHFLASAILFLIFAAGYAQSQEVPYTLEDRDRLVRVESRMDALEMKVDARFDQLNSKFEQLNSRIDTLFWVISLLAMLMILVFGFLIWDRRTALRPAINKATRAENTCNRILCALHDYAREDDKMGQSLKSQRLM